MDADKDIVGKVNFTSVQKLAMMMPIIRIMDSDLFVLGHETKRLSIYNEQAVVVEIELHKPLCEYLLTISEAWAHNMQARMDMHGENFAQAALYFYYEACSKNGIKVTEEERQIICE